MTTKPIHTPYDATNNAAQALLLQNPHSIDQQVAVGLGFARAEGYRQGYADAQAKAARLVEAAWAYFAITRPFREDHCFHCSSKTERHVKSCPVGTFKAALAPYRKED